MKPLTEYFSQERVLEFSQKLPGLRSNIGVRNFATRGEDYGVSGNTLRAYRGYVHTPSRLYRTWAKATTEGLSFEDLEEKVNTRDGYLKWHASMAESLIGHWQKYESKPLPIAHKYKLVDLYVKWLSCYDVGQPGFLHNLVAHANCALDSQTLKKLNECYSYALPLSKPSMGLIQSEAAYSFCQDLIGFFASECGGSRLMFDFFAWKPGGAG